MKESKEKFFCKIMIIGGIICEIISLILTCIVAKSSYNYFINNIEQYIIANILTVPFLGVYLSAMCCIPFTDILNYKLIEKYQETEEYKNYESLLGKKNEYSNNKEKELSQQFEQIEKLEKQQNILLNNMANIEKKIPEGSFINRDEFQHNYDIFNYNYDVSKGYSVQNNSDNYRPKGCLYRSKKRKYKGGI